MKAHVSDYGYIAAVIGCTVYGQLIVKWRVVQLGALPADPIGKLRFVVGAVFDPYIASGLAAAVLASLAWIAAMTRMELSFAYPFMALNFVLVLLLGSMLLGESVSLGRWAGVALIVLGTVVAARS